MCDCTLWLFSFLSTSIVSLYSLYKVRHEEDYKSRLNNLGVCVLVLTVGLGGAFVGWYPSSLHRSLGCMFCGVISVFVHRSSFVSLVLEPFSLSYRPNCLCLVLLELIWDWHKALNRFLYSVIGDWERWNYLLVFQSFVLVSWIPPSLCLRYRGGVLRCLTASCMLIHCTVFLRTRMCYFVLDSIFLCFTALGVCCITLNTDFQAEWCQVDSRLFGIYLAPFRLKISV